MNNLDEINLTVMHGLISSNSSIVWKGDNLFHIRARKTPTCFTLLRSAGKRYYYRAGFFCSNSRFWELPETEIWDKLESSLLPTMKIISLLDIGFELSRAEPRRFSPAYFTVPVRHPNGWRVPSRYALQRLDLSIRMIAAPWYSMPTMNAYYPVEIQNRLIYFTWDRWYWIIPEQALSQVPDHYPYRIWKGVSLYKRQPSPLTVAKWDVPRHYTFSDRCASFRDNFGNGYVFCKKGMIIASDGERIELDDDYYLYFWPGGRHPRMCERI